MSSHRIQYGVVTLDTDSRTVTVSDHAVPFTPAEFAVLEALLEHPGYVCTRAQLVRRLPAELYRQVDRIVEVYVRNIRRKLHGANLSLGYVETVFGSGYRVEPAEFDQLDANH